jgi:hypothetical protein
MLRVDQEYKLEKEHFLLLNPFVFSLLVSIIGLAGNF